LGKGGWQAVGLPSTARQLPELSTMPWMDHPSSIGALGAQRKIPDSRNGSVDATEFLALCAGSSHILA